MKLRCERSIATNRYRLPFTNAHMKTFSRRFALPNFRHPFMFIGRDRMRQANIPKCS